MDMSAFPPKFSNVRSAEKERDKALRKVDKLRTKVDALRQDNRRLKRKVKQLKTQVEAKQIAAIGHDAEFESWD